jgi:hypothetical protein
MINLDELTVAEIRELISAGTITEEYVVDYYRNEFWDDEHE